MTQAYTDRIRLRNLMVENDCMTTDDNGDNNFFCYSLLLICFKKPLFDKNYPKLNMLLR
jgi:hypothetical protein